MAKSVKCKREKRLRTIKRDMVEPYYEKKEAAKLSAREAALAAPQLPVRDRSRDSNAMELSSAAAAAADNNVSNSMDLEMADGTETNQSLKPVKGVGKKRKFKVGKRKQGKGRFRIRRKNI